MTSLESLLQDLRYGVRSLGRERLSTGRGGRDARPRRGRQRRDLHAAERHVAASAAVPRGRSPGHPGGLASRGSASRSTSPTVPEFLDVRSWNQSFETMAFLDHRDLRLTGGQEPERVFGGRVTASFFPLLGAEAALGRVFTRLRQSPRQRKRRDPRGRAVAPRVCRRSGHRRPRADARWASSPGRRRPASGRSRSIIRRSAFASRPRSTCRF